MTTYSWINAAGGLWSDSASWDVGVPDVAGADVVIGATGSYSVTIAGGYTIGSLLVDAAGATALDQGTLAFAGGSDVLDVAAGTFSVSGVLQGATVVSDAGSVVLANGATLDDVTYQGTLDVGAGDTVNIEGGLTVEAADGSLPGTIYVTGPTGLGYGGNETLNLLDSETLDNVTLVMGYSFTYPGGGSAWGYDYLYNDANWGNGNTLTLGAGATLLQTTGYVSLYGNYDTWTTSTANNSTLINNGQIVLSGGYFDSTNGTVVNAGAMTLGGGETADIDARSFTNSGVIGFTGAGTLRMNPGNYAGLGEDGVSVFDNQGLITIGAGDTVLVTAATLDNEGIINIGSGGVLGLYNGGGETDLGLIAIAAGGTLELGTDGVTPDFSGVSNAGAILVTGTLIGGTIVPDTGLIIPDGGTAVPAGGTVALSGGVTLDGVTYQGTLDVGAGNTVNIEGGLTVEAADGSLPGTIYVTGPTGLGYGDNETLNLLDSETLDNVTLVMGYSFTYPWGESQWGSDDLNNTAGWVSGSSTLTLGAGALLLQTTGYVNLIGNYATWTTSTAYNSTLINNGQIDLSGGYFQSTNGTVVNAGAMTLGGDETADIDAQSFTNTGEIGFSGAGTLRMNPNNYDGLGYDGLSLFDNQGLITIGAGNTVLLTAATLDNEGIINIGSGGVLDFYNGNGGTDVGLIAIAAGGTLELGTDGATPDLSGVSNAGEILVAGTLIGGTIVPDTGLIIPDGGTAVPAGGTVVLAYGATLDDVTYQGTLDVGAGNTVNIEGGLTVEAADGSLPGTIYVTGPTGPGYGDNETLNLLDSETLDNVTLVMGYSFTYPWGESQWGSDDLNNTAGWVSGSSTLTLGAGALLLQTTGYVNLIGNYGTWTTSTAYNSTLINNGQIDLSGGYFQSTNGTVVNAGAMTLGGDETADIDAQSFTNTGEIGFSGAGTLRMNPNNYAGLGDDGASVFDNQGLIAIGAGDTVLVTAATLDNEGIINIGSGGVLGLYNGGGGTDLGLISIEAGGTLELGTDGVTPDLSGVSNAGEILIAGGILSNVTVDAGAGLIVPNGGTAFPAGGTVVLGSGVTLDAVTYQGVLSLSGYGQSLFIENGLTLENASGSQPGSIDLSGAYYSGISVVGSGTLDNATLNFGGAYADALSTGTGNDSGNTLTLGRGFTIVAGGNADYLGYQGWVFYASDGGDTLDNAGLIDVTGGDLNIFYGTFNNTGSIAIAGGALTIQNGTTFTSTGTVTVSSGGVLDLQTYVTTAALAGVTVAAGGVLGISGQLDNTGATLDIGTGSQFGVLDLRDGTILGGTVADAGSALSSQNGTLDGVTYQGVLSLAGYDQSLFIENGLTLENASGSQPGGIDLSGAYDSGISVVGSGTLDNATLNFGGAYGDSLTSDSDNDNGNTLTLNSGFTIVAGGNADSLGFQPWAYYAYDGGDTLDNAGLIDVTGGDLYVYYGTFNNTGSIAIAGGALSAQSTNFNNSGIVSLSGGAFVFSSVTIAPGGTLTGFGSVDGYGTTITDNGLIEAQGGDLYIQANESGTGTAAIAAGATLQLGGPFTSDIAFATSGVSTLALNTPGDFTGTLDNFADGGVIDFLNTQITDASLLGATLQVTTGGTTYIYQLAAALPGRVLVTGTDASGTGTDIAILSNAEAEPEILTPLGANNLLVLPDAHVSGTPSDQETLAIANAATRPADGLNAGIASTTGDAFATGTIASLAPGATDTGSITVGLNNTTAGAKSGTVALTYATDGSVSGIPAVLPGATLDLTGNVYRYAEPSVTAPSGVILHVGDDGGTASEALNVANLAPADGYSEALLATATGTVSGGMLSASGATGDIAASLVPGQGGVPTDGLIGYWTGDGTAADSSATGNNGTFYGSYAAGLSGEAFNLATGGVVIPNNAAYALGSDFSVGFWFNFNGYGPSAWDIIGQDVGPGSNPKWFIDYDYQHGDAFEIHENGPSFAFLPADQVPIPAGWNQLTLVKQGSTYQFYLNGISIGVDSFGGTFPQPSAPLQFGFGDGGSPFPGLLQDVVLYDRALSPTDVQALAGETPGATNSSALTVTVSTATAGYDNGTATVALTSDGTGIDTLGTTSLGTVNVPVSVTIDNYATAAFEQTGGPGTIIQPGTLNLGSFASGQGSIITNLGLFNTATGPADWLTGQVIATGSGAFTNTGTGGIGQIGAGGDAGLQIAFSTAVTGTFTETLTFAGIDGNASGFSEPLPDQVIEITGTVLPTAAPELNTTSPIDFGNVHQNAIAQQNLSISNTAPSGSAPLNAAVIGASGEAYGSGAVTGLAPGATDTTDLLAGLGTGQPGVQSGTVTVGFSANFGTIAPPAPLGSQTVTVQGTIYQLAAASVTAPTLYLHANGSQGGAQPQGIEEIPVALTVTNTAPADGYSENLLATITGTSSNLNHSTGTADVAPSASDSSDLSVLVNEPLAYTPAAVDTGTVTLSLTSDGTGIDGLGTTSLGSLIVPIVYEIDNYATAAIEQTGGASTLTQSGSIYTLNLGSTQQYAGALTANLAALNAALGPAADVLNGSFTLNGDSEYANTGFGAFSGITFGSADTAPTVTLNTGNIGTYTEQIVLDPTGSNPSGYSGSLTTETIDVTGTIVPIPPPPPPPLPTATAWGDVHITTFDGLYYDFQAEGEFVLARSTQPGDDFQIQARLQPWSPNATVSVITMLAVQLGSDRVTFALDRTNTVWINGAAIVLEPGQSRQQAGGTIAELSANNYQVTWGTGEVLTVSTEGSYINATLTLAATDTPGTIQGLWGSDTGQGNDFQLANGTVLPQPLSSATLYGAYADAWRVTNATSLMDYGEGLTTANYTDPSFPTDAVNVGDLPAAIYAAYQQEVIAAGITDPNQQAAAILDLAVTGNPAALLADLNVDQGGQVTQAAIISTPQNPVPALGVSAVATSVVENPNGTTAVTFNAYLTMAAGTDTVIDWAVQAPDASDISASAFGGTFPSGFVIVPAGQTSAQFTVNVPNGVLGVEPSAILQVGISTTNGDPVFAPTAQTQIVNDQPEPGSPAIAIFTELQGSGYFSGSGDNFTLDLGTLVAGENPVQARFDIANDALAPSDFLTGTITGSGTGGFDIFGANPLSPLSAGASYQGLVLQTDSTEIGPQRETIVFAPVDGNITGYSEILPSETVVVSDRVLPDAEPVMNTPATIDLGTFYQGQLAATYLSFTNAATIGSASLDVYEPEYPTTGEAEVNGTIDQLAPELTNDTGIAVGLDTGSPGVQTGTVALLYASDAGNGNTAQAGGVLITVEGTVYGPANAYLAAVPLYVHQGDDGGSATATIQVSNTAPDDGYAENLNAEIVGFGPYVTAASGSARLAPGQTDATDLTATLSTAALGVYAGDVAVALQSDGTGIDSNGITSLGTAEVQVSIDVNQYAVAAIEQVAGNGTFSPTGVATSYILNLGTVAQYATPLGAQLGVLNDVLGNTDLLEGSFSIAGAPEFDNSGFGPFQGLGAQQTDTDPIVVLSTGTVGTFTETLTLDPVGYNPSGYAGALSPVTVTVTGTVVAAPPPTPASRTADVWGDVHITTFDGLYYDFQAEGEFVLSRSTVAGDTFQVQARTAPWSPGSSVSVTTAVAADIGQDRVTFDATRANTVWVDGAAVALNGINEVVTLADGTLEQLSSNSYRLIWNTGEELTVTDQGTFFNTTLTLPNSDAGKVQGLLGNDAGDPTQDLQLADGTELSQPTTYAILYGEYADSWRVTDASSLLDYSPGQDTASFTDVNFPYSQISLGQLPPDAVAMARAAALADGITDPNLQNAAIIDYLVTGNVNNLIGSENVQQQEGSGATTGTTPTAPPQPVANVGVFASTGTVVESTSITQAVGFYVFLTSPETTDTRIEYTVRDPGPGFLSAADLGGVLPSGTVTIAAGQTSAVFTVALPADVLGDQADADLQVVIGAPDGEVVFAPIAQVEVLAPGPTPGNPAQPLIEHYSGTGLLSGGGTSYTLNFGSVEQYSSPLLAGLAVLNNGTVPADLLSGSFIVNGSTLFENTGFGAFAPLAAGNADTAPELELLTGTAGTFSETITLSPTDSNDTGYSAPLVPVTITVTGTIVAPPPPPEPPEPVGSITGDVHIYTYDGTHYDFQQAGEFVLTQSTIPDDTFEVQGRMEPTSTNASVSWMTQIAAEVGTDRLTFGTGRADTVWLNGTAEAIAVGGTLTLAGGSVQEIAANTYRLDWATGESMTVQDEGFYLNTSITLTDDDIGAVQGLLGPADGEPATDLQLTDGTALPPGTSGEELYGAYANDWRVTQPDSLLDYGTGETTATYTDLSFPYGVIDLSALPADIVQAAENVARAAGITDPILLQDAALDLLASGVPTVVDGSANIQQSGVVLVDAGIGPVANPLLLPEVGIVANESSAIEATVGTIVVPFTIYLTAASAEETTVTYQVTTPSANYLGLPDIVGGTGSGSVQIAAGQTEAEIDVAVLANALGSEPQSNLQVTITPTLNQDVISPTAQTAIVNPAPTAGNPAIALIEQLSGNGSLTGSGTQYVLNLGTQVQNGAALFANLGIANAATVPADGLSGDVTITNFTDFFNSGFDPFSSLAPGQDDAEPVVKLNTGTIGVFTETIVLDPTDTNATGYSAPMNDVTITATGTIVAPPPPPPPPLATGSAFGDVHIITYDGLEYDFQAVGEFTLAKSTVAGNSYDIQVRLAQYGNSDVSVISQIGAALGSDRVTFGIGRDDVVYVNGFAQTFSGGSTLTLADGSVQELSGNTYLVTWDSGETMTVTDGGSFLNVSTTLSRSDTNTPGSVQGLLGENETKATDFQLADGTVLQQPITTAELYGIYANAWRITQYDSLLDYGPGQQTATFTNLGFPADSITFNDLPTVLQQEGMYMAEQAGITDPGLQQAAALDFIVTGDPDILIGGQNVTQQGITTTTTGVAAPATSTSVGVSANSAALVEPASGNLAVGFTVYLNQAEAQATTIDYTVGTPGAGYLDASAFGGTLPSGSVTIAAGQTSASFTVAVAAGVLGSLPDSKLQVNITPQDGEAVFAPSAQTTIVNDTVETGTAAEPAFVLLSGAGALTRNGNAYTLDLGNLPLDQAITSLTFGVVNGVAVTGNDLAGTLKAASVPGFTVSGAGPLSVIAAGNSYQGLRVSVDTAALGSYAETITFTPVDQNVSGYSSNLTPITLTITDQVQSVLAAASAVTPNPVDFGNVHLGAALSQPLSLINTAVPSKVTEALDGSIGSATGAATSNGGAFTGLAAGDTDSTSLAVGLSTAAEGVQSGMATITLASDGSGIDGDGRTPLPSQTVDVTGTVYALAAPDVTGSALSDAATLVTLAGFAGAGSVLQGSLVRDANGDLFGVDGNSMSGAGSVFEIANTPTGYASTPTILASFSQADPTAGYFPMGSLVIDASGDLFGTTEDGGAHGVGTAFEIVNGATGYQAEPMTLLSFSGTYFQPSLAFAGGAGGSLFGTANNGGTTGAGAVFEIANTPTGYAGTLTTLASFTNSDGANPVPGLASDAAGDLFGVTLDGGTNGDGTVFELSDTNGTYATTPTTLFAFDGADGLYPQSGVIADSTGDLFGTTSDGGSLSQGTVFELKNTPTGYASAPVTLVNFTGLDGSSPIGALVLDSSGDLFGTTAYGGTNADGVLFEIVRTGSGYASTPTILTNFDGSDGSNPVGGLTLGPSGSVLGTTASGGAGGGGTAFALSPGETLNLGAVRVGGTAADQSLVISDGTTADPYQESLVYSLPGTLPAGFAVVSGGSGTIVSGATADAQIALSATNAGLFSGTTTLALTSTGIGTSGLADTALSAETITLEGAVFAPAVAQYATALNFGLVHVGAGSDSQTLSIANTASGALTDVLTGSVGAVAGAGFSGSGSLGTGVAAGASGSLSFALSTASAGVFTGSATLALASHDADLSDLALITAPIALTGTIVNYATAAVLASGAGVLTGSGTTYTLNLGSVALGSGLANAVLSLENTASGPADGLAAIVSASGGAFVNSGFGALGTVAAGQTSTALDVGLLTSSAGTFTEVLTVALASTDSAGSTTLAPVTIDVTGTVTAPAGQVFTLTTGVDTVAGGSGTNTVLATSGALSAGDTINAGSGGNNTLALQGSGVFNLTLPAALSGIETITAQEGQPSAVVNGVTYASEVQTVDLRAGMNGVTLQVSAATPNPANPSAATITIVGAANNDTIMLASGSDTVTMGQGETLSGGTGADTILVTASTISDVLSGGTGGSRLYFTGGGTITLGGNVTNFASVYLASAASGWNLTANNIAGLVVQDASTTTDTVAAGGVNQILTGGGAGKLTMIGAAAGSDTVFKNTAALFNGDVIENLLAGDLIDITGLGFTAAGTGAGQTSLALTGGQLSVMVGGVQKTAIGLSGSYSLNNFSLASDGGTGTVVGYHS